MYEFLSNNLFVVHLSIQKIMKKTNLIFFFLIPVFSTLVFPQIPDLEVRFSVDKHEVSKGKNSLLDAEVRVANVSGKSLLIVVDEPIRLSHNPQKRELGLGLERNYNKYDFKPPNLKLLKAGGRLIIHRKLFGNLFSNIADGKWSLDSTIGYIAEKDFEKLGITIKLLKKKKSKDRIKVTFFNPTGFAEIQLFKNSESFGIDVNPSNKIAFGDKLVQDDIKKKTAEIYNSKSKPYFFSTTKSFGEKSTCGTEITAYQKSLRFNRIISKTCTKLGRQTTEFYFGRKKEGFTDRENLIFVYQVFEIYDEKARVDAWRNFKGLASWESRYYFVDGILKFHQHKGRKDISEKKAGSEQKAESSKILTFVKSQISK